MKTAIATLMVGLLALGGLAWAQMRPSKPDGMMQQHAVTDGSKAGAMHEPPQHPMQGMGGMRGSGMMGNMMGSMMKNMMGTMMGPDAQDDVPFIQGLLQQRERLKLVPEQVQQLQTLATGARKALIRHEAEVQVTDMDLETLLQADPVDLTQVEEAVKRQESQRTEMRLARLNAIAKAKALLTPEQRQHVSTQLAATSQDMPGMMGCPMMGQMMGHPSDT